jgi:para-aminobenzoate synthetase/4-amino-4-deoxychorismate lyase
MTSTITAEVTEEITVKDIFRALFPCGSITGAPKISTMNIIAQLESTPREVYCGAIGYITPEKEAIFNVPIRTVLIDRQTGKATYGVGGGITWDSTTENEYHEILAKMSLLKAERPEFQLLESLLVVDRQYFLLEEHLERLAKSSRYFGYTFQKEEARKMLLEFANRNSEGSFKVRFLLSKEGGIHIEAQRITQWDEPLKVILANKPIDKSNLYFFHKTTNRDMYSTFQKPEGIFDVLLWNEDSEITEFTNGNVVLEIDGEWLTPPLQSGLLAGTFRQHLIETGRIHERILTVSDIESCTKMWFINSVRKWIEVTMG